MNTLEGVFYITLVILAILGLLYLLRRFVFRPIMAWFEKGRIIKKFGKSGDYKFNDKYVTWVKEKMDNGWRYTDVRRYGHFLFSKKELPELLYTYIIISELNKQKGVK